MWRQSKCTPKKYFQCKSRNNEAISEHIPHEATEFSESKVTDWFEWQITSTPSSCRSDSRRRRSCTRTVRPSTRCGTTTICRSICDPSGTWARCSCPTAPSCAAGWPAKPARSWNSSCGSTPSVPSSTGGRTWDRVTGRVGSSRAAARPISPARSRPAWAAAPAKSATWSSCAGTASAGTRLASASGSSCTIPSWRSASAPAATPGRPTRPISRSVQLRCPFSSALITAAMPWCLRLPARWHTHTTTANNFRPHRQDPSRRFMSHHYARWRSDDRRGVASLPLIRKINRKENKSIEENTGNASRCWFGTVPFRPRRKHQSKTRLCSVIHLLTIHLQFGLTLGRVCPVRRRICQHTHHARNVNGNDGATRWHVLRVDFFVSFCFSLSIERGAKNAPAEAP